jgi:transcriptional regulator with GAF, ATPase, and Fis domain
MISRIRKDKQSRTQLFARLEENNRTYLFNPGDDKDTIEENEVIDNSIRNFKTATQFISNIANGNLEVQWTGITKENETLNTDNLAGELLLMRDKMKTIKTQDEIRNWTTEGLARFSEVIRGNQESIQALCFDVLVFIVKYLKAQQGGMFVVKEEDGSSPYLDLTAAYAFNRKKYVTKRIEFGQGMIGQTYLEGQSVILTEVPQGYTEITSGLGESTPGCLLIVPLKYNEKIEAIVEIASFKKFEQYEIEFIEKVGESIASTLSTVKNTEKMKFLVDQFQSQTEQLKAQEEELRQNMEEMQATQEAFRRQEQERNS